MLFYDKFFNFRKQLNNEISKQKDVKNIVDNILSSMKYKCLDQVSDWFEGGNKNPKISHSTEVTIQRELIQFLKEHQDELKAIPTIYHLPQLNV